MNLSQDQREAVVRISGEYLGRKREIGFSCVDFVRTVYGRIGIEIPLLMPKMLPPVEFNLRREYLLNPPLGEIIFFKDRSDKRLRLWTHLGIVYSVCEIIHCSLFLGEQVVITPIEFMWRRYDFVESVVG
jgi:hypothetical protein